MITIMYDDNVERVTIRYHYHYQNIIGLPTYLHLLQCISLFTLPMRITLLMLYRYLST